MENQNMNRGKNPTGSILKEYKERVGFFYENVLDKPLPDFRVTEETKELAKERARRCRGSVRLRAGLFYTEEERENQRNKLLNVTIP